MRPFPMRHARPKSWCCATAAGICAVVAGWTVPPIAYGTSAPGPRISDCVGAEDGHDSPVEDITNKEWVYEQNNAAGYDKYATCRFVITRKSAYVDLSQRVMSDTYGACDGPKWTVELKATGEVEHSKAEEVQHGRDEEHYHEHGETLGHDLTHGSVWSVTGEITDAIAKVLNITLSGSHTSEETTHHAHQTSEWSEHGTSQSKTDSTQWAEKTTGEQTITVEVPEGKRVYFQYAPWLQKSTGYLQLTYWRGKPGAKNKVAKLGLTTHTPLIAPDGKPRLDFQTRWLGCRR